MKFPKGFIFGLANADHQVESHDPRYEDVWDVWERTQNRTPRRNACKFEEKYAEDIKLAADLGTKIFRFSVSWAKVQQGPGEWNEEQLAHYRKVAQCVQDNGMKVMVTLVHFTWPVWLERDHDGLIGADFPEMFAKYADKLAETFGDIVDYWISFNEPTQVVHGYIKTWWQEFYYMPPGMPEGTNASGQAEAVGKLIHNLFSAHAKARLAIKNHKQGAKVGINPLVTGFPPWLQWIMDHQFHTDWLLKAMYKFSYARPLIVEKGRVDLVIGGVTPKREDTLLYSRPYFNGVNETDPDFPKEAHHIAMPAGHNGLLQITNSVIAEFLGEKVRGDSEEMTCQPLSLADHFASEAGGKRVELFNGEGLKRIRRRGVLTVGVRENAPGKCEVCSSAGLEISIAHSIAKEVFGDPNKVEFVELSASTRPKALSTKVSFINKIWHFVGAAGLIANANWWYLGSKGKLPKELCPEEAVGAHDFVGFDYYWGLPTKRLHQFPQLLDAAEGRFLTAPVWPKGLRHALRQFHRWFPEQEIMIIENGCVPLADGIRRRDYLEKHLHEVAEACKEGIPVSAYLLWSLTSNREWGHAFDNNTDFGLYHVGLDDDPKLERKPSKEVDYYRTLIQNSSGDF